MRFGNLLDLFREDNWSNKLVGRVTEMLDLSEAMFQYTTSAIMEGTTDGDPQQEIYDRDHRINQLERKTRRRVVSRLSVGNDNRDVPSALIFMNVVKDGERLGDYIKNLHEIADMMPDNPDRDLYRGRLQEFTSGVLGMFAGTREAFSASDEEKAGQVIKTAKYLGRDLEAAIRDITGSDLPTRDAVCLVLTLRFYKRLVAHMSNIASTIVMPLDLIDFYDEPED